MTFTRLKVLYILDCHKVLKNVCCSFVHLKTKCCCNYDISCNSHSIETSSLQLSNKSDATMYTCLCVLCKRCDACFSILPSFRSIGSIATTFLSKVQHIMLHLVQNVVAIEPILHDLWYFEKLHFLILCRTDVY